MFELAKDSRDGADARAKAIAEMKVVLSHFLGEATDEPEAPAEAPAPPEKSEESAPKDS